MLPRAPCQKSLDEPDQTFYENYVYGVRASESVDGGDVAELLPRGRKVN
jgi:hypothetical protein